MYDIRSSLNKTSAEGLLIVRASDMASINNNSNAHTNADGEKNSDITEFFPGTCAHE